MNEPTAHEIIIRGHATERILRPLVDDFTVDHPKPGCTRLTGVIQDPAHLHGVLAHLTSVAAEVISLMPIDPDPNPKTNGQQPDQTNERHKS